MYHRHVARCFAQQVLPTTTSFPKSPRRDLPLRTMPTYRPFHPPRAHPSGRGVLSSGLFILRFAQDRCPKTVECARGWSERPITWPYGVKRSVCGPDMWLNTSHDGWHRDKQWADLTGVDRHLGTPVCCIIALCIRWSLLACFVRVMSAISFMG